MFDPSLIRLATAAAATAILLAACARSPELAPPAATNATAGHSHDGWWCGEHGIPEEECAQCNSKLAADFQKKGDWCQEHNRPDSQCFVCHPDLEATFAAKYEAKYGQPPPKRPAEGEAGHDHSHAQTKS
jgi:cobalt-zinc-cadmium efflux system membrane fusion protein